jgi:hypothetical protein
VRKQRDRLIPAAPVSVKGGGSTLRLSMGDDGLLRNALDHDGLLRAHELRALLWINNPTGPAPQIATVAPGEMFLSFSAAVYPVGGISV